MERRTIANTASEGDPGGRGVVMIWLEDQCEVLENGSSGQERVDACDEGEQGSLKTVTPWGQWCNLFHKTPRYKSANRQ